MLPLWRSGKTSTFASPSIRLCGNTARPDARSRATSACISPSTTRPGRSPRAISTAAWTLRVEGWSTVPKLPNESIATRGSWPNPCATSAAATAMWASCSAVGSMLSEVSAKKSVRSRTIIRWRAAARVTPSAVPISSRASRITSGNVRLTPQTTPSPTPRRCLSSKSLAASASRRESVRGSTNSAPSSPRPRSLAAARARSASPTRTGVAIPSSRSCAAAFSVRSSSASANATRARARLAPSTTVRITSRVPPSMRSSRRTYASRSNSATRAEPSFIAASATAGATQRRTRGSKGFGIR